MKMYPHSYVELYKSKIEIHVLEVVTSKPWLPTFFGTYLVPSP